MTITTEGQTGLSEVVKVVWDKVGGVVSQKPTVLALCGPLGAGKTAFTKELGRFLGINPDDVTSPTFVLHVEHVGKYPAAEKALEGYGGQNNDPEKLGLRPVAETETVVVLDHLDVWRIEDWDEVEKLGLPQMLRPRHVVAVEWADKFAAQVEKLKARAEVMWISFAYGNSESERVIKVATASGQDQPLDRGI